MFSGIVERQEKPISIQKGKMSMRMWFITPKRWKIQLGQSIAIDGICATVESVENNRFSLYFIPETLRRTNLAQKRDGHRFNLERPLRLNSFIGGHLVSGHIDTAGRIIRVKKERESKVITVHIPKHFSRYLIYKGSVAVNGVSLTVVSWDADSFTVALIPYTLSQTNLSTLKPDDLVNIEFDLVAKYLEKLSQ